MNYPWYDVIKNNQSIEQGDFIPNCPIVIPPVNIETNETIEMEIQIVDVIVLSQSCDLENNNIEIVQVCPYKTLKEFITSLPIEHNETVKAKQKVVDNLRKGFLPGYHILNKFDDHFNDYLVVDFRNLYGIHINALKLIVQKLVLHIRLLPPYREHLSQAFARFFMRVGLPQDIKVDKNYFKIE